MLVMLGWLLVSNFEIIIIYKVFDSDSADMFYNINFKNCHIQRFDYARIKFYQSVHLLLVFIDGQSINHQTKL